MVNGKVKYHVVLLLTQEERAKLKILTACAEQSVQDYLTRIVRNHIRKESK